LKSRIEYNKKNIHIEANNQLKAKDISALNLHDFLLKAEKLGHNSGFEITTKIKFLLGLDQ
jgi:hypothetical protein